MPEIVWLLLIVLSIFKSSSPRMVSGFFIVMKVEIDNITLGVSPLTGNVFAGIPMKDGKTWRHKKEVTNDFLTCVIRKWENQSEIIDAGPDKWEITVKKIK